MIPLSYVSVGDRQNNPPLEVQRATPEMAAELIELHHRSVRVLGKGFISEAEIQGWVAYETIEGTRRLLEDPRAISLVAKIDCKIVGYAISQEGEVLKLYTDPEYAKGQGVGKALLREQEKQLGSGGWRSVRIESSPIALGFYVKMGYAKIGDKFRELPNGTIIHNHLLQRSIIVPEQKKLELGLGILAQIRRAHDGGRGGYFY